MTRKEFDIFFEMVLDEVYGKKEIPLEDQADQLLDGKWHPAIEHTVSNEIVEI